MMNHTEGPTRALARHTQIKSSAASIKSIRIPRRRKISYGNLFHFEGLPTPQTPTSTLLGTTQELGGYNTTLSYAAEQQTTNRQSTIGKPYGYNKALQQGYNKTSPARQSYNCS
ncbi:hypothetical protein LTR66_004747, partial [Elasticomyces elasticus]